VEFVLPSLQPCFAVLPQEMFHADEATYLYMIVLSMCTIIHHAGCLSIHLLQVING